MPEAVVLIGVEIGVAPPSVVELDLGMRVARLVQEPSNGPVRARVDEPLRGLQEGSFPVPAISAHEEAGFGVAFGAASGSLDAELLAHHRWGHVARCYEAG